MVFFATAGPLTGQFHLDNPSFEGEPQDATVPVGWFPCARGTTPDILPGPWGVREEPADGETFVGLITRADGSWESIGQRFRQPLEAGECYSFTIDVAHSSTYAGYNGKLKLRIWGGRTKCRYDLLLLETDFIASTEWERFKVTFTPEKPLNYLLLEAHFSESQFSHKGNLLLDNIGPIKSCARASLIGD